jgi:hypothetical protein
MDHSALPCAPRGARRPGAGLPARAALPLLSLTALALAACERAPLAPEEPYTGPAGIADARGRVASTHFLRPFSAASPWNRPIASYAGASYAPVQSLTQFTPAVSSQWPQAGWVAVYQATETDPLVTLYFHPDAWDAVQQGRWKRWGNSAAVEAQIRAGADQSWYGYQANQYSTLDADGYRMPQGFEPREGRMWSLQARVPRDAVPPPDSDGLMTVYQPDGRALEMIAPVRLANGDLVTLFAGYTDPAGDGTWTSNGRRASMLPAHAGLLRRGELATGRISHALNLTVGPEALTAEAVWPAGAFDRNPDYTGSIPMGALLAIPPHVNLAQLQFRTAHGRTIARAAQEYGMYVTDRSGRNAFVIATEYDFPEISGWSWEFDTDLKLIRDLLQRVTLDR